MKPNRKLLLGILLTLVVTGCAPPSTAASKKIYFDLERDPAVLVNESGVDIVVEKYNICYGLASEKANASGWSPISLPLSRVHVGRTPPPGEGDTYIRAGSSVPANGACPHPSDMQEHDRMNVWLYQKGDEPTRRFAVYSDNVDPSATSPYLPVTTSALASSPFQVKFHNTTGMTISVSLNCVAWTGGNSLAGDLDLTHLERQTDEGWELLRMNLPKCNDRMSDEGLSIAPQASGSVDWRSAYPANFTLEKGRYRWVANFCIQYPFEWHRCYTSFSPTFDYPPEQAQ
jgi:hypothetical protein